MSDRPFHGIKPLANHLVISNDSHVAIASSSSAAAAPIHDPAAAAPQQKWTPSQMYSMGIPPPPGPPPAAPPAAKAAVAVVTAAAQPAKSYTWTSAGPVPVGVIAAQNAKNLLAPNVELVYDGKPSVKIAQAVVDHFLQMNRIKSEFEHLDAEKQNLAGHDSHRVAQALVDYAKQHQGEGIPRQVKLATSPNAVNGQGITGLDAWYPGGFRVAVAYPANADGSYTINGAHFTDAPFSFANTVQSLYWAQVIYCIVWITTGVLLTFNGWASFNWLSRVGVRERSAVLANGKKIQSRSGLVAGGIGGCVVGFLFISFFVTIIMNAVCARGKAPLNPTAYFALWLAPSLVLGVLLGGHFRIVSRAMSGLLAGVCMTIILTAVFGIHAMTTRVILLSIFCSLFTAPLLLMPRNGSIVVQRHLLNVCTSIIGMVTFLTGVALFAPPEDSSSAWIDLWIVLFAETDSASQAAAVSAWGTPAFKGYIAGAVLGAVIGFIFEFFVHSKAGLDAQEEWNDYLGGYTQRFTSNGAAAGVGGGADGFEAANAPRAGLFEPSPTAWQRIAEMFNEKDQRPASYGHDALAGSLGGGGPGSAGAFTELNPNRRAKSTRKTSMRTPAKFHALAKGEKDAEAYELEEEDEESDEDDDDETDVGSDLGAKKSDLSGEAKDAVAELKPGTENYRGYALPRPPSYRTESAGSGTGSGLSGSTKASSTGEATSPASSPTEEVHRPLALYTDAPRAPSPVTYTRSPPANSSAKPAATAAGNSNVVPATPSLINAISRIQQAQAQAKAWQDAQASKGDSASPYGPTIRATSPSSPAPAGFDKWWDKEVKSRK